MFAAATISSDKVSGRVSVVRAYAGSEKWVRNLQSRTREKSKMKARGALEGDSILGDAFAFARSCRRRGAVR